MRLLIAVFTASIGLLPSLCARADELDTIRHTGALACALSGDADDASQFDSHGDLSAYGADMCRALAAAILGDARKIKLRIEPDEIAAIRDVHAGRADIMIGTTPDPALDLALHVATSTPLLIDGLGLVVDRHADIHAAADLKGKRVCWLDGTPSGDMLPTRMNELGIDFTPFPFQERGEMESALATGHCAAVAADLSQASFIGRSLPALAQNFVVLPQMLTTDPFAAVTADGQPRLAAVVEAVATGLVAADAYGITRAGARAIATGSKDLHVRRLLGSDPWQSRGLGLDDHFLLRAIEAVGNQAEIYDRDVGPHSPLHLPQGPNRPVSEGGALMSLPVFEPR